MSKMTAEVLYDVNMDAIMRSGDEIWDTPFCLDVLQLVDARESLLLLFRALRGEV